MGKKPKSDMADLAIAVAGLLKSEKYADLTLRCQGVLFKVHCAVVCTRSPVLSAAVDGQFKEAVMRDIDLSADELPLIQAMINYLYLSSYDDKRTKANNSTGPKLELDSRDAVTASTSLSAEIDKDVPIEELVEWPPAKVEPAFNSSALLFNVKMYILGDKYDVPGLRRLAKQKYEEVVNECWNTTEFSESLKLLWDNTVDSDVLLRNVVLRSIGTHLDTLLDRGEFLEVLRDYGDLCVQVLCDSRDPNRWTTPVFKKNKSAKVEVFGGF